MDINRVKVKSLSNLYRRFDKNGKEMNAYIEGMYNVKINDNSEFQLCYQIIYDDHYVAYIPVSSFVPLAVFDGIAPIMTIEQEDIYDT